MKVSFDFDSTLDRQDVQRFAKELVKAGHEVWVVTSRCTTEYATEKGWHWVDKQNRKLFRVADNIGIKREHIVFTNHVSKSESIKDKGFVFHLDDDVDELMDIIATKDPCKPINVDHFEWEMDCRKIIEIENYLENPNQGYK